MILFKLTLHSLWNRRASLLLTLFSIAISVALLLGVEYIRKEAKSSFLNTISGTDLVVGARSGPVQLLLYSVFRIGNATNNISWQSYQDIAANPLVEWTIPISLGDSHQGYRVLGTNQDYFRHYRYADKRLLAFAEGKPFAGVFDAVLGAEVARKLGYRLGDNIVIAHGAAATSFTLHDDKPFTVTGILAPTGTPLDRTVHVSLEGIEAIHIDWVNGAKVSGYQVSADEALQKNLQPKVITAFMVGLKNRAAAFRVQRDINDYKREPLLATVPGVALADLWQALGMFETVLRIISGLVVVAGLLGMLTTLLSTLNERRREMAILRAVGAYPRHVFLLFVLEAGVLAVLGCLLGAMLVMVGLVAARPWVMAEYGLYLSTWLPDSGDALLLAAVAGLALLFSLIPGAIAYRRSLQDGLTVRV
ncbi:MAG TPA: ABC transporter permease [Candidatus Thiothrix moscowensis]|uniref:ABC transporter permease n=1 Tax=unclassified Thiothrix TaxID=2636184 RepID=UPI0025F98979|nr:MULTISPECIES: ABC transporter permease [unclassified Thiothrix]HRJ52364.1 ABC transporter permease [Candidatus Thiothrix moscowensis]HRJ92679.1 ABC transporter permease [Candidatus Thiothrix moscowensis]